MLRYSGEAASTNAELSIPRRVGVLPPRVPSGRPARVLPLVRHTGGHERALPGASLRYVRVVPVAGEPGARVQPGGARAGGRVCGRARRRRYHTA